MSLKNIIRKIVLLIRNLNLLFLWQLIILIKIINNINKGIIINNINKLHKIEILYKLLVMNNNKYRKMWIYNKIIKKILNMKNYIIIYIENFNTKIIRKIKYRIIKIKLYKQQILNVKIKISKLIICIKLIKMIINNSHINNKINKKNQQIFIIFFSFQKNRIKFNKKFNNHYIIIVMCLTIRNNKIIKINRIISNKI